MKKLSVAVLGGGPSSEYAVSLRSAAKVVSQLDSNKYVIIPVTVDKLSKWHVQGRRLTQAQGLQALRDLGVEVIFIAMHGEFGEDGTIQQILDEAGFIYTGSGAAASRLAMDKDRSKQEFVRHGLAVPGSRLLGRAQWERGQLPKSSVYPIVIKPLSCGSSVGVSIVEAKSDLPIALERAFDRGDTLLIEEYISGREVTCGVLDDGTLQPLPPTEIRPKDGGWFDYEAKYQPGASEEITPAPFPDEVITRIQQIAISAHKAVGCYGMSRTDMIVNGDRIVVLETNTIPGLTETSLLPQEAAATGLSYSQLLDRIIESAVKHKVN